MSVHQVEEWYLHMKSSEFDLKKVESLCNEEGLDFENQGEHFVIETFHSEDDAESFEFMLKNEAGG